MSLTFSTPRQTRKFYDLYFIIAGWGNCPGPFKPSTMHEFKLLDFTDPKEFSKSLTAHINEGWAVPGSHVIYQKEANSWGLTGKEVHYTILISRYTQLPQK